MQKTTLLTNRRWRTALLVLLLGVVGMGKTSAQDFTVGNLNYSINNDGTSVTVTGHVDGTSATGTLNIPESVTYEGNSYAVTVIGYRAFYNCSGLTGSLIIPSSVTTIEEDAFHFCSGFTGSLTISNSVTTIGDAAFCKSGFTGNLTIPNSVTTIGDYAFTWCYGFSGSLTISNSVTTISDHAFGSCNFTGSLTIPNSVTSIGSSAFNGCSSFTGNLNIPNSVTTIGIGAFSDCSGFTGNLNIPNSVTTIEREAFSGCTGLTSLTIGSSVTTIGDNPFSYCSHLVQIIVDSGNLVYDSRNNCNAIIETNTNELISGCMNFTFPNSVTSIGNNAFRGCSGITGSLTIPNSVTTIGYAAFQSCSNLTSLTIGSSVTTIGFNPFCYCSRLEQIIVDSGNLVYDSRNNCNAIIETNSNALISGCMNSTIPNSVTTIGNFAFQGCSGLTLIEIPNPVTSIGDNSFHNCTNLTSLTIGNSVTTIGKSAFSFCSGLTSITVLAATPPSVGSYAFRYVNTNIPVTVLCGCASVYEASNWANYFTSIEEDCDSHDVNIEGNMSGGNVSASVNSTTMGEEVQLTITPEEGMMLSSLTVSNSNNPDQQVYVYPIGKSSFLYGFIMPPFDVVVSATFTENTSVQENNNIEAKVYPNPTNGMVKIESEKLKHITISNTLGQVIYEGNVNGDTFAYDFSGHQAGIYLIRIETASSIVLKKVSVAR